MKMLMFLVSSLYNFTVTQLSFKFFCWATRLWVILEFVSLCVSFAVVTKWSRRFHHLGFGFLNYSVLSLNQMHLFANNHVRAGFISIASPSHNNY
jgi:hypothetical protein